MAIGNQIGGIQIFAEIYQGATTYVYKGYQASLERFVLLKILRPEFGEDQTLSQRFEEEAKLVGRIQHPNVVAIYDYGRENDVGFIAAEFVDGVTLHDLVKSSRLPVELACYILLETAKGLQAAHDKSILHQDIKPSNILISNTGQVKLTDFGMASVQAASQDQSVQEVRGTLAYMSPEQILGDKINGYSDIFSLGATFYEMLMGTAAFSGDEGKEYLNAILNTDPIEILRRRRDLPVQIIAICETMLAKDPAKRYPTCQDLIDDLQAFERSHPISAGRAELMGYLQNPEGYAPQTPHANSDETPSRRAANLQRPVGIALTLTLIAGLLFGGWFYRQQRSSGQATGVDFQNDAVHHESRTKSEAEINPSAETKNADIRRSVSDAMREDPQLQAEPEQEVTSNASDADVDASGYLNIACIPWAAVFINGDSVGTTPLNQALRLPVAEHELRLKNPQFPVFVDSVSIEDSQTANLEISLWALVGRLDLEVSPWAKVYIDGEYRDTVPPQDLPLILTPGTHALALEHPTLGTWQTSVDVSAGEILRLRFNLRNLLAK